MVAEQLNLLRSGDMENQGVVLRTALGFKNFGHGGFVQTVGAKTVDGFGRNRYQFAAADHFRGKGGGTCVLGRK